MHTAKLPGAMWNNLIESLQHSHGSGVWWLPKSPDAIYGAIVGGLIAIMAAGISGGVAIFNLKSQLTAQRRSDADERAHELKREVYLPLFDLVGNAAESVLSLEDRETGADEELGKLQKQVSLVSLIGSRDVVFHVRNVYATITHTDLELINLRAERKRVELQQKQLREDLEKEFQVDGDNLEPGEFQKTLDRRQSLMGETHQCAIKIFEVLGMLTEQGRKLMEPMFAQRCDAMIAVRRDLGMSGDEAWLRELVLVQKEQLDEKIGDVMKKFREETAAKGGEYFKYFDKKAFPVIEEVKAVDPPANPAGSSLSLPQ